VRAQLDEEARVWSEALLRSRDADPRSRGARLLRVLSDVPTNVADAWQQAVVRTRQADVRLGQVSVRIPASMRVFCPRSLLVDVFGQVLENAAHTHASTSSETGVDVKVIAEGELDRAIVTIVNNRSRPRTTNRRGGLSRFGEKLALFGGTLVHGEPGREAMSEDWTYEIRMSLPTWRELA